MYSNNILNSQEYTTILNARTKRVWKLIEGTTNICMNRICHKQPTIFDMTSNQTKPMNNSLTPRTYTHLTVCKQIGDVKLNS